MQITLEEIQKYKRLDFLAIKAVEGFITGLHKSPYHGFSVEFAEHRPYNTGDNIRHIDWKLYARTDKLFIKKYEEETNLRCRILIDTSSSMFYPQENKGKLSYSAFCAAAIMLLLNKQRDAVGLSLFNEKLYKHTACKSTGSHINQMINSMNKLLSEEVLLNVETNISSALHEIAKKSHQRSLIILFSDMFDNKENHDKLYSSLQHLKHMKHEVIIFHTLDPKTELDFDFDKRPHEFIGLEDGKKIKVSPYLVQKEYKEKTKAYFREIELKCGEYKIEFNAIPIDKPLDQVLLPILAKRKRMRT